MANFKSVELFNALNTAKNQGLTIEKAKVGNNVFVDTLPYGEYSLANIAQVSNTIKALAQHIYDNFIPSDRIIPSGTTYKDSAQNNVDLIFYKLKTENSETTEISTNEGAGVNFRKYLITGENLRENIKYHKPKINGTQNYDENSNFIIPTAPAQDNYTARNGTLYGGKGNTAEFLGVQISQNYKEPDSNKSSAELKNKDNKNFIVLNMSTPFSVDGNNVSANTDTPLTYIDENLNKNTLVISSGGIAKSKTNNNTFINTIKDTAGHDTTVRSFTFFSGVDTDGTLKIQTVNFSARGLITNISTATNNTDGLKVINKSNQEFTGVKTFKTGIGLPSSAGTGSYIYLS